MAREEPWSFCLFFLDVLVSASFSIDEVMSFVGYVIALLSTELHSQAHNQ